MDNNCHMCGHSGVQVEEVEYTFYWGDAEITVNINVYSCGVCDLQYTDNEADQIRHNAVMDYRKRNGN